MEKLKTVLRLIFIYCAQSVVRHIISISKIISTLVSKFVSKMTAPIEFTKWADLVSHCVNITGCNPFSSEGINIRLAAKTAILRSVDGTEYYDDDLSDPIHPKYTLFGKSGDQSLEERRYNKKLLDTSSIENIYLYRVCKRNRKNVWIWYSKYRITGHFEKMHPGDDGIVRKIIVLKMERI
jgi:hypothetical protein